MQKLLLPGRHCDGIAPGQGSNLDMQMSAGKPQIEPCRLLECLKKYLFVQKLTKNVGI